jgi:hypothetical protein
MSERADDLRDEVLGVRLEAMLGTAPSRLTSRREHLTPPGLHSDRTERCPTPRWHEVGPQQSTGMALLLDLLTGVLPRLLVPGRESAAA